MTPFERVFKEAGERHDLNELRRQLTANEVPIATQYLKNLIASRPKDGHGEAKPEA